MSKRYNVTAARPKKDGGTWWHKIGSAFEGDKGITVFLDSLPIADSEGKVKFSLFEEKQDHQQERVPGSAKTRINIDDEIPF